MQSDHILRTPREVRDVIEVQGRGVGGENGALPHYLVQGLKHLALDLHALEHRLDAQVDIAQQGIVQCRGDERQTLLEAGLVERALAQRALVVAADVREATVERVLLRLQQHHRQTRVDEAHGDASTHGPGADDADLGDRSHRGVIRHVEYVRGGTLGLKHMTQRRRLGREHQRGEQFPLLPETQVEGFLDCRGDRLDAGQGRGIGTRHGLDGIARELEEGLRVRQVEFQVAHELPLRSLRNHAARKVHGALEQVAVGEGIEEGCVAKLLRGNRRARNNHIERGFDAE
jgi:hypothetical protein